MSITNSSYLSNPSLSHLKNKILHNITLYFIRCNNKTHYINF